MPRIELDVAFADLTEVKRLGARWDALGRIWYVPDGTDPGPFRAWIPIPPDPNVRSAGYYFGSAIHPCPHCGRDTEVFGFVLPAGHTILNVGDFEDEDEWEVGEDPTLLCEISYLSPAVARFVTGLAPNYRLGARSVGDSQTWLNHCSACGATLDDNEVFCEPGLGFFAVTEEDARRVALLAVHEEFVAVAGSFSFGVSLFEEMPVF